MNGADVTNVMAADESIECLTTEETLANAPTREDDYLRVRAVLERRNARVLDEAAPYLAKLQERISA